MLSTVAVTAFSKILFAFIAVAALALLHQGYKEAARSEILAARAQKSALLETQRIQEAPAAVTPSAPGPTGVVLEFRSPAAASAPKKPVQLELPRAA